MIFKRLRVHRTATYHRDAVGSARGPESLRPGFDSSAKVESPREPWETMSLMWVSYGSNMVLWVLYGLKMGLRWV